MAIGVQQQQRRGTAAQWNTANYVLAIGELGVTIDTGIIKIGDGVNGWNDLPIAFGSDYLPILGKAADSELLDGISSSGFLKTADATTAATADKVALRNANGRLKAATGIAADDLVNYDQMVAADLVVRQNPTIRTVSAGITLQAADINGVAMVGNSNRNAVITATIPTNATVPIAIGSWVDICATGIGTVTATPAGGVTLRGDGRVYGNYGVIRLLKTATDTWLVSRRIDPSDAYARAFMFMNANTPDLSLFWRHCPLNDESFDTHNGHVTGAITGDDTDTTAPKQTNRYTCQPGQAGTYSASAMVLIQHGSVEVQIAVRILKNGVAISGGYGANSFTGGALTGEKQIVMAEGDWIGLQGYCDVPDWNFVVAGSEASFMSVERVA